MRDWYDNPQLEERLEEQDSCLPRGPIGLLLSPIVEIDTDRPSDALALLDAYLTGEIGTMEFASSMEVCRMKFMKATPRPSV